ncbi:trimethylamine methyltransferase family protein [candidate division WOR-3 bacterium]|nr:trimethylamine methyltransferase family protein [candidate division WOR-3 bacterium]
MKYRPRLKILSDKLLIDIIDEAFYILERVGVKIENKEALNLLKETGAKIKNQRVYISENLARKCLKTTPSSIKIYDRNSKLKLNLKGNNFHFVPGSAALFVLDSDTREIRRPTTEDYIKYAKLTNYLTYIDAQSTAIIPRDVPYNIADRYRLYLSLLYGTKPIITGTFTKDSFSPMVDMLMAVRGSKENLKSKPLAIFDVCPSPPLKWSDLTCQCLIDCAKAGIPAELVSMPLAGAAAPVTLSGSLVQHTAESLSGIVIGQLANPGTPIIYGGSPAIFDMKSGTTPMGAIETMMMDMAYVQIGKKLKLPTHTYMGLSDSKTLDSQSGIESGIGIILSALAGVNVISGPGMLGFENCQSLEKLVIDNEICGMAKRLIEGIVKRESPMAKDIISGIEFLKSPSTIKWFKKEQFLPSNIIDRKEIEEWGRGGNKSSTERAKEEVKKILSIYKPVPLNKDIQKELQKIIKKSDVRKQKKA